MMNNKAKYFILFLICLVVSVGLIILNTQKIPNNPKIKNTISTGNVLFYGKNNRINKIYAYYTVDINKNMIYKNAYLSSLKSLQHACDFYAIEGFVFILDFDNNLFMADLKKQECRKLYVGNNNVAELYEIVGVVGNLIVCVFAQYPETDSEPVCSLLIIDSKQKTNNVTIDNANPIGTISNNGNVIIERDGSLFILNVYNHKIEKCKDIKYDISDNYYDFSSDHKTLALMDKSKYQFRLLKKNVTDNYIQKKSIKISHGGVFKLLPDSMDKIIIQEHLGNAALPFLPSPDVKLWLCNIDTNEQERLKGFPLQNKWCICY